ncbi:MAG: precorrin-3B C(17)-methyltransferase [Rickettsiales bacterium]
MTGWLKIVGLGAGSEKWLTPEASEILHSATDIIGYETYVNTLPASVSAKRHASDNGVEVERAEFALELAANGAKVAVVSGGDAGVFGMAAAIFEAVEAGDKNWRDLDIETVPAVSAMLAVAARIGAPLGHDFCAISLSTYLKPWAIIEKRLRAASEGDFVLAIYNPASKQRREDLQNALDILRDLRGGEAVTIIATNVGRAQEKVTISTLSDINSELVTMQSLLIIGSTHTRLIKRAGKPPFVFTPRYYSEK